MQITINHLKRAKPENVIRLAKWLKINTEGLNIDQIIGMVYYHVIKGRYKGLWR
jgi:hypothetical protein